MEERIKALFAATLRQLPETVADDTAPDSVPKWDSMQHLILISGVEEEFGVDIEPDEVMEMYESFGAFKRVILRKIAGAE